ncbi:class I SAM-dependent methyltransferase [Virgibacillus halophilus]|uniref:Class I SAM-dependent methyltransferase n=1 Tax=Tigheibacillus halophilus TaxID=361280 RepID=A0ABU5C6B9_9BACI|nr:class I SAM-dependent methyltransferase [Virgibacillus halophilus]
MGIDFHDPKNSRTYTMRIADKTWMEAIKDLIPVQHIKSAVDIGCGGGIYTKALADMGAGSVTGVDFSHAILEGTREHYKDVKNMTFKYGDAFDTALDSDSYHLVLERALIHHVEDLLSCFQEVYRLLKNGGYYILQDRTPEDCLLEGDNTHIRGYCFELFPRLMEREVSRRHKSQFVIRMLKEAGFNQIEEVKLWEIRKVHTDKQKLQQDLSERTGRSILHELNEEELDMLLAYIDRKLPANEKIYEKDRWTIWKAEKS